MNQKRRNFIKTTAVLGMGLPFLGCSSEMKKSIMNTKYVDTIGLQLWTVRNQLGEDFEGTIKSIAEQGYHQIEIYNFDMMDKYAAIAKEVGLKIFSSHISSFYFTGRWNLQKREPLVFERLLEKAEKNGLKHIVVGYLHAEERTLDDYKRLSEAFNIEGEKAAKAGITLGYHNHNFEFMKVEGEVPYDLMRKEIEPKNAQFELDVFWADIAGVDPVGLMKKMKGQIKLLHLKDKKKGQPDMLEGQVPQDAYKELGNGEVDIKTIIKIAEETGVEYCFVEQDESPNPIASTKTSMDWLKKNFKKY